MTIKNNENHNDGNNNISNNNHLDFWDIPFQPREEFSRRGLLPPILNGIFNLVILRTSALPNPRYPALPRQDTSYTWTLADRCYQLWLHSRWSFGEFSLPSCRYTLEYYRQSHRRPKKSSIKKFDTLLCCFRPARFAAGPLYRFGFISLRSLLSQLTPSMTEITLGHTFCEQILNKRAVILQVTPEHVRYLLILVYVYEHLRQDA